MPPGSSEEISDWWGVIKSTPPGAQFDDYFERQDLGQVIYFWHRFHGPGGTRPRSRHCATAARSFHLYGTLFSNVPDYNGSQIQVDRIEVEE